MQKVFVIAGYYGVGKTYMANHFKTEEVNIIDLESFPYEWIKEENGDLTSNPNFPDNYIQKIAGVFEEEILKPNKTIIFVSHHAEVLTVLAENDLLDAIISPSANMKTIMLERFKQDRGWSEPLSSFLVDGISNSFVDGCLTTLDLARVYNKPVFFINPEHIYVTQDDLKYMITSLSQPSLLHTNLIMLPVEEEKV